MTSARLETLAAKIKSATDIWELHKALMAFESAAEINPDGFGHHDNDVENDLASVGIDLCMLPTLAANGRNQRRAFGLGTKTTS